MTGRRAIAGLCMLNALLVSAFAAQSASAVTRGTTAFTCVTAVGGPFKGEHCLTTGTAAASKHVEIAQDTTTKITGTNANTASNTEAAAPSVLKGTITGVPLELTATTVEAEGSLTNKKAASGEHYTTGTGTITFTGVIVHKPNVGCRAYTDTGTGEGEENVIHTNELKATTEGQGDFVKFEPVTGNVLATFWVTCPPEVPEALGGTYQLLGSVKCPINGATIVCSHSEVTTQNTLKVKGVKAGFEGAVTIKGRHPILDPEGTYKPITGTTVETP